MESVLDWCIFEIFVLDWCVFGWYHIIRGVFLNFFELFIFFEFHLKASIILAFRAVIQSCVVQWQYCDIATSMEELNMAMINIISSGYLEDMFIWLTRFITSLGIGNNINLQQAIKHQVWKFINLEPPWILEDGWEK